MLTVYLAGGYDSTWRQRLADELRPEIHGINPFANDQESIDQFVSQDLESIRESQLVIAYHPGGYRSYGMAAEIGYARACGIPVFFVDETPRPCGFLVGCSKRLFTSLDALIEWWNHGYGQRMSDAQT